MRVVVCGAQMPFARGGAELHMENLVAALVEAGHEADLVRIPTAWDRVRLFDSVLAWRMVPLDCDLVIATNFPSYFVQHPNKVVWVFHQHRGFYDAADAPWSDIGLDEESIELQRQLTEWDITALSEARLRFCTSQNVSDRMMKFCGVDSEPLYHPAPLADRLHAGPFGDYVFCVGRMEQNKRPDLLAEAMRHVTSDTRLVLGGPRGSVSEKIDRIAAELGDRIELAGFVSDEQLLDLYAGALGVVYPPADEDYGYVTLQGFGASKPVITCTDSGGTLEFVRHGETGLVAEPTPESIAAAIDELAADRARAETMGVAGRAVVEDVSWAGVVDRLLA